MSAAPPAQHRSGSPLICKIEVAGRVDVGLDTLQQAEPVSVSHVDAVNGLTLSRRFLHRHSTGDLQPVRMIGDSRIVIAAPSAGIGNLLDRRVAIAPFGVHLQIASVLVNSRTIEGRVCKNPPHFGTAQEVTSKVSPPLNVRSPLALFDRLLHRRRGSGLEDLADDTRRTRPDAGDSWQGPVRAEQVS